MKITNTTDYETADLRRFAALALKTLHVVPEQRAKYRVEFHYKRKDTYTDGRGLMRGLWMELKLPRDPGRLDVVYMASVMRHERAHNLGISHREMDPDLRYCFHEVTKLGDPKDWAWLWGFQIRLRQAPAKPSRDAIIALKLKHAQERFAIAVTRAKRANTLKHKWARRVLYYDRQRQLAAAKGAPDDAA